MPLVRLRRHRREGVQAVAPHLDHAHPNTSEWREAYLKLQYTYPTLHCTPGTRWMPAAVTLRSSALSAKREHFSDAAADDGRKVLGSHLGISVIKLTPKEKDGRERERGARPGRAGRRAGRASVSSSCRVSTRRHFVSGGTLFHSHVPPRPLSRLVT